MKVKGTGSRCLLQECVKDKYYARFHLHSYHCCREMNFISRLDVNFLDSTQNIDKSVERELKFKGTGQGSCLKSVSRTITMQGFILTANTAAKK